MERKIYSFYLKQHKFSEASLTGCLVIDTNTRSFGKCYRKHIDGVIYECFDSCLRGRYGTNKVRDVVH